MSNLMDGVRFEDKIFLPVLAGSTLTFNVNDLMYWDASAGAAKPASAFTWATSDALTRRKFRSSFVGVAMDSQFSDSPARLVCIAAFAECDMQVSSGSTFKVGDTVGVAGNGTTTLYSNIITNTTNNVEQSIGKTVRVYSSSVTTARVQLYGTKIGTFAKRMTESRIVTFPDATTLSAAVTTAGTVYYAPAYQVFGGSAEVLAAGVVAQSAFTAGSAVISVMNNGANIGTIGLYTTTMSRGYLTEVTLNTATNRVLNTEDLLTIQCTSAPGGSPAGALTFAYVKYRPLW